MEHSVHTKSPLPGPMPREFIILQHNCNASTNAMQGLMESDKGTDIIAIQELYIGNIRAKKMMEGAV
jgi:hypothetical protein